MTKIKVGSSNNSIIIGDSVSHSKISINAKSDLTIFDDIKKALDNIDDINERKSLQLIVEKMENSVGSPSFLSYYKEFIGAASNHITVLSPFFNGLASLLT